MAHWIQVCIWAITYFMRRVAKVWSWKWMQMLSVRVALVSKGSSPHLSVSKGRGKPVTCRRLPPSQETAAKDFEEQFNGSEHSTVNVLSGRWGSLTALNLTVPPGCRLISRSRCCHLSGSYMAKAWQRMKRCPLTSRWSGFCVHPWACYNLYRLQVSPYISLYKPPQELILYNQLLADSCFGQISYRSQKYAGGILVPTSLRKSAPGITWANTCKTPALMMGLDKYLKQWILPSLARSSHFYFTKLIPCFYFVSRGRDCTRHHLWR